MADAMDHEPVTYGSPKPPTVEERQASRIAELHRAEQDLWLTQNAVNDAHAELDRLDVPRETHDGYLLSLATRIRYATCGTHRPDAQPRLLQEWAPDVWSGRRQFPEEAADSLAGAVAEGTAAPAITDYRAWVERSESVIYAEAVVAGEKVNARLPFGPPERWRDTPEAELLAMAEPMLRDALLWPKGAYEETKA